jgi:hypothetical protein
MLGRELSPKDHKECEAIAGCGEGYEEEIGEEVSVREQLLGSNQ